MLMWCGAGLDLDSTRTRTRIRIRLGLELGLAGHGEEVVVYVDGDVLLAHARELERRGHEVLFFVLVDIDPRARCQIAKT